MNVYVPTLGRTVMFYTAATLMCGHGSVNKIQRYVLSENTVKKQPQPNRKAVKVTGNV